MTLFIDASALVAWMADEVDRRDIGERIAAESTLLWSPMSCWEAVSALCHSYRYSVGQARNEVEEVAAYLELTLVPIGEAERSAALDAYQVYGKGRHPANLNMGDCFAYACAKTNDAGLLYKGSDFAKTDLA